MKKILFLISISFILNVSFGQTTVSEIVKVDSALKKSTLFSNGLAWFAYQFKSSNDVIQMKDLESGKIIGKGIFEYVYQNGKSIPRHILITLTVKDGKYKYDIELEIIREFQIEMEAACLNCGKTTATITYSNGSLQISNIVTGRGNYHYDNENVGWMERGNYKKWKIAVDEELPGLRNKLENDIKAQEISQIDIDKQKIKVFIDSLKLEMIKTNSDF
jgi:hypothetical protein